MKLAAALVSVLALVACSSTGPAAPDAANVKLYALDCGHSAFRDLDGFSDEGAYKGQARELIVPCYLIRHPKGDLIWDTGLPEALADLPGGFSPPNFPATFTMPSKLSAQLAQLGLAPADIEFVSLSHLHADHSGNGGMFAASTWIVDKDERDAMFSPAARGATDFANYRALETAKRH